jgi:tripartite-type tricarboxylate transporter receptor subunit TctC
MKLPRRQFLHPAAGAAALPAVSRFAWTQTYPTRPVRMIVPYAPGGSTDVFARLIAQKLTENLGRQFFVENIGGAGGNIGMGRGAKADPDGHTIVLVATPLVINPSLYGTVPYDPIKDFDPVTLAVSTTTVLAIHPSVPAQTTRDLVAVIRANPGKYFSSPGTGTPCISWANCSGCRSSSILYTSRSTAGLGDRLDARGAHSALLRHAAAGIAAPQGRQAACACGH